ncbi:glutamate--tRNA ligase [Candidatus Kaiserbacteria bacterium]|nr:glutamate--tRNA ligase [Candidatus Kaiserbacteria bacterium]MCB9811810.1 glutamate--tRNA ligase [Candidatus Nomurabacteria bacterium]
MSNKVVTRFAPSPTGFLHIGGVRTALFAYLWAKKNGGQFILRIEDTDKKREVAGSIEQIMRSLSWLGISWEYGPDKPSPDFGSCLQSERLATYKSYAERLVEKGLAYPDTRSAEELDALRDKAQAEGRPFLVREHRPKEFETWDGQSTLRFKVSELKRYTWHDVVRGQLSAGEEALDDFIIMKADGFPTYNFAHIIDDLEMGVTHIFRTDEFISSTPKFLSLYEALEIKHPIFTTLPPIMGPDGKKKLSKRDGAKDTLDYAKDGYLPSALCNFLALIGWNPGGEQELFFTEDELASVFSLEKIQRSGGAFNEEKLRWMNSEHLKQLGREAQTAYVTKGLPDSVTTAPQYSDERLARAVPVIIERIHNLVELRELFAAGEFDWLFKEPSYDPELLKWKNDDSVHAAKSRLQHVLGLLETTDFSSPEAVKNALWGYAEEIGRGEVLWPLRVALSGKERSPDPFMCAYILGPEETQKRVATACAKIAG